MAKTKKKTRRLSKAKKSLAEMLENLRPFLPKSDLSEPESDRTWKLPEEISASRKSKRTEEEVLSSIV